MRRKYEITEKIVEKYDIQLSMSVSEKIFEYKKMGFTDEAILEAAKRTNNKFKKINFPYMFAILNNWYENGSTNIEAIKQEDLKHVKKKNIEKNIKNNKAIFEVIDTKTEKPVDISKITKEAWCSNIKTPVRFAFFSDGNAILVNDTGKIAYCPPGRFYAKKI